VAVKTTNANGSTVIKKTKVVRTEKLSLRRKSTPIKESTTKVRDTRRKTALEEAVVVVVDVEAAAVALTVIDPLDRKDSTSPATETRPLERTVRFTVAAEAEAIARAKKERTLEELAAETATDLAIISKTASCRTAKLATMRDLK
jgi:hypothetical protein